MWRHMALRHSPARHTPSSWHGRVNERPNQIEACAPQTRHHTLRGCLGQGVTSRAMDSSRVPDTLAFSESRVGLSMTVGWSNYTIISIFWNLSERHYCKPLMLTLRTV